MRRTRGPGLRLPLTTLALLIPVFVTWAAANASEAPEIEIHPLRARPIPGPRADVAALLLTGNDSGSLTATAVAVPRSPGDGGGLDFWLEIDGEALLRAEESPPEPLRLELHVYAMTRTGQLAGHLGRRVTVPVDELTDVLREGGVLLAGRLATEPVETQLRMLVRETHSQRFALRVLYVAPTEPVASPSTEPGTPLLPPELSPDAGEAWVVRRNTPVTPAPVAPDLARQPPPLELEAQGRASRRVAAIATSYRDVLERVATGATTDAVTRLLELEAEVLESNDSRRRAASLLRSAQEEVIKKLAKRDPESLIPLLVLHVQAHDRYLDLEHADAFLLGAARQRIRGLARTYAEETDREMTAELAGSALAELGFALDRAGLPMASLRMLEEALALDDSHGAALLYLAYWHERRGAYADAVPLLRRLIAVVPQSKEGRLRLALAEKRIGRVDEAVRLLRQLIHDGAPDKFLTIAYQELGRALLGRGDSEEAARLLEAAITRLPTQQRLYVQLAYLLDRTGDGQRGREVLAAIPADTGQPSPRNLYSRRPAGGAGRSRATLVRHANARLPLLAQVLADTEEDR